MKDTTEIVETTAHDISTINKSIIDDTDCLYYISDIHIERKRQNKHKEFRYSDFYYHSPQIRNLIHSIKHEPQMVFFAGDITETASEYKDFLMAFYFALRDKWPSSNPRIYTILGNHELWGNEEKPQANNYNQIVAEYKMTTSELEHFNNIHLLENEIYFYYKGKEIRKCSCEEIMQMSLSELTVLCQNSSYIIVGGIGFSGLNKKLNAKNGLYKKSITRNEEINLSKQFARMHDKLASVASEKQVIVLSHMPMSCWSESEPISGWIYINGHTHRNVFKCEKNKPIILADGQIGYSHNKPWIFKQFRIKRQRYDPFESYPDGIHQFTSEQYEDFCWNRNEMGTCSISWKGDYFFIKKHNYYMFFVEEKNLCILNCGTRKRAEHCLEYYYDNIDKFAAKINETFTGYCRRLEAIGDEIKKIGGCGRTHGCIVDVDSCSFISMNHIFLNPVNGMMYFYWAKDTEIKIFYNNLLSLIEESPDKPDRDMRGQSMANLYTRLLNDGELQFLPNGCTNTSNSLMAIDRNLLGAINENIPTLITDKKIYEASRDMHKVFRVVNDNVICFWHDAVLDDNCDDEKKMLEAKQSI